ncbi:sulfite reductase [NADPH] flavoalpha-component domain protein [Mycobacteroides abscessus MAB_110811_2726]|nr:sulfite reductase [NADPH] flavoalpha-component domain protein [Mycobacteroides abscessus MAB_110811_2726]
MKIAYIPEDAPFNEDQRAWLSGFLAGLHSRLAMNLAAQPPAATADLAAPGHHCASCTAPRRATRKSWRATPRRPPKHKVST